MPQTTLTAIDPLLDGYDALPHFDRTAHPNVDWQATPLEKFHPEQPFDYIFCLNVINHVRDLGASLRVLAQALSPNGKLVLSVDAHRRGWLLPIFRAVPGDILHPHQLDLAQYEAACRAVGLRLTAKQRYAREAIFDYWVLTLEPARARGSDTER